jgi:hypothetical protein
VNLLPEPEELLTQQLGFERSSVTQVNFMDEASGKSKSRYLQSHKASQHNAYANNDDTPLLQRLLTDLKLL